MPVVNIDATWLNELLGQDYPAEKLTDAMEQIGCDVEEVVDISRYRCPACSSVLEGSMGAETVNPVASADTAGRSPSTRSTRSP